jgi:hypothetical protein
MRPVRNVDPADLWFGAVFGVVSAGVFALAAIVVWATATSGRFWTSAAPFIGLWIAVGVARGPIGKLSRGPRFLAWFILLTVLCALFTVSRGDEFNPALAAGLGLALAVLDFLVEHCRSRREAKNG